MVSLMSNLFCILISFPISYIKQQIFTATCRSDCEHFGIPPPEFPQIEELQADIGKHETVWSFYEEFSNGLDALCSEDWISFRLVCRNFF